MLGTTELIQGSRRALWLLCLLLAVCASAPAERLPLKTYTTADGLAHNTINRIVRDGRGFLWFCTEEGLSRFDGYQFTNYGTAQGLPHAGVNDILETRAGDYWVATNGGLVHFNPRGVPGPTVVFADDPGAAARAPMFTVVVPADTDRRARAAIVLLEGRDGTLWCGTFKGLFRLAQDGARVRLLPVEIGLPHGYAEQQLVSSLLEDRFGTLWVATFSGLYRRWPDGSFTRCGANDGFGDVIHVLREDRRGSLWVGTRSAGLFRLMTAADHSPPVVAHNYTDKDGLGTDWIFDLYESADGKLWVGTNRGFCELSLDATGEVTQLRAYTKSNGLSYHEIASLTEDRDGNLWLGTDNNGAMKLARPGFTTFAERDGLYSVTSLFETGAGELYAHGYVLGNKAGVSVFEGARLDLLDADTFTARRLGRFDGRRFEWFIPAALTNRTQSWSDRSLIVPARTGEWWMAMDAELDLFPRAYSLAELRAARPVATYMRNSTPLTGELYSIYEDSRGDLWVATVASTGNGLLRWERATRTLRDMGHTAGLPALKDHLPAVFQEDRAGHVWVGFAQGELARYAADRFEVFTAADGLTGGRINALYLDHAGRLWVATSRGLSRVDDPSAEHPVFVNYSAAQGLSGNVTFAVTEDLYGRIYVGTGQGLDQLDTTTGRVKHYTTADGLAGGKIAAAFRARDGQLWVGTTEGLSRFLPEPERQTPAPPVLLTGLQVAGTAQNISALGEVEVRLPDLPAGASQLQIDFVGLGFAPGESLRYQYTLEGADAAWSAPTAQRTVTYARLAPGRYRFLVRAVNADGQVSPAPAAVTFRVLPPLWLRWWFIALVVLSFGGAAYALYRYRVARLLEVANMRTRIATDLHDDIGSGLSRVAILSEVVKQQTGATAPQAVPVLTEIADSARGLVDSMRDIVWAIDPRRDDLSSLIYRVRQFAADVLEPRHIRFDFPAPPELEKVRLDPEQRRHLFLICKEAVNNVARHADCTEVAFGIEVSGNRLTAVVSDDGRGFAAPDLRPAPDTNGHGGHGLENMRRRAAELGGQLELDSAPGHGTRLKLTIPLKKR